jgi:hypothetical protein
MISERREVIALANCAAEGLSTRGSDPLRSLDLLHAAQNARLAQNTENAALELDLILTLDLEKAGVGLAVEAKTVTTKRSSPVIPPA